MFRNLILLLNVCLLFKIFSCQEIDLNICPNGLTNFPPDPQWPNNIPNRFEIITELTTDVETIEITQLFLGHNKDVIYFHNYEANLSTYYDFEINEMLTINDKLKCDRTEIKPNEYLPFATSQIVKPSILLGFNGRNKYNDAFFTRYIGKETIRDGILTQKFQACFYIDQENITINATYYISESSPDQIIPDIRPDIVQIDVRSNDYPYTYNIIRYVSNPSLTIKTPSGAYCPNRTITKEFPQNIPSRLSIHADAYTLKDNDHPSKIESYNRLIDESSEFERLDYTMNKIDTMSPPSTLLVDYSTKLQYMYTRQTQQCTVTNLTTLSMHNTNELLFQFGHVNDSIRFQYTGLTGCGREHIQCHRWIGQYDSDGFVQQYEWFWSATFNEIDLQELIPIKAYISTTVKSEPRKTVNQEINIFNYNSRPNSMQMIDSTLGECYRSLGPSQGFNYAILRMTLNNDEKYPVHKQLLSLERHVHIQLANDLKIRHIRLSSFVIDITRDTTDHQDKDIYVTFTLLENPPGVSNSLKEPSLIELIRQLAKQINDGHFHIQEDDGPYDLYARPNSLQTLVLYLSPSETNINYSNETIFVYHNITQIVYKQRQKIVLKRTGPLIAALWTGFVLLGMIVTIAISSFVAIRKWLPTINHEST
ncbi:unnamed protein product [Adineta steineri]|uniref:LolA-like domain-containing protein n=1 Tax=Adineta steineri TaxID=433720 RepID=A0A814AVL4_9BILA|nr:unnamed protein product [Adineta steineri]